MFELINPYTSKDNIYKGQLHCHSNNSSDNAAGPTPVEVLTYAQGFGYNFICITDHDHLTTDITVDGMLYIPGVEETGLNSQHLPIFDATIQDTNTDLQTIINNAISNLSLITVAHPHYSSGEWTTSILDSVNGFNFIEIYNPSIYDADNPNAEDFWDYLLSKNNRVFGIAVSDAHYHSQHSTDIVNTIPSGFVQVYSNNLTLSEIKTNLKDGNFYASNGPDLTISLVDFTLTLSTSSDSTIEFIKKDGIVVQTENNVQVSSYTFLGTESYIRGRITRNSDGLNAWSQPFFIHNINLPKTQSIITYF